MATISMPRAYEGMASGTVLGWRKAAGDRVDQGEILVEIEAETAKIELSAGRSGILEKILCPPGATAAVDAPIAVLSDNIVEATMTTDREAQASSAEAAGGVIPILMPQAGQSMEEGTIVKWRVQPGQTITKGDIIFDVETDKATVEVEAVDSGRLARIVVPEGEVVPVLVPVAYLADDDADVDRYLAAQQTAPGAEARVTKAKPSAAPTAPSAPAPPAQRPAGPVKASPAARKLAQERGIDLSTLGVGSGPGGRIISSDIPEAAAQVTTSSDPGGAVVHRAVSGMRKAIARNLLVSKQTIPHFYMQLTISADAMMTYYRAEKAKYRCSVNDVITLACARVLQEFPAFRSRFDNDGLMEFAQSNIGVAVGMDDGLVVPVLLGAEKMNLEQVASESRRIAEAARGGKIEGLGRGVFTITNLGMFGVQSFSAIINPPEAGILAVGAVREDVVVREGSVQVGQVLTMTLSCDHRIVDGLIAAKFLDRLRDVLENPGQLA